jgi:hypothetical protein
MKNGEEYEKAHERATDVESAARADSEFMYEVIGKMKIKIGGYDADSKKG